MVLSMFLGVWKAGLKESFVTHSALQALEPYISGQIMQIHHSKHHQTYVNNLNAATANHVKALQENDIRAQINLQQAM